MAHKLRHNTGICAPDRAVLHAPERSSFLTLGSRRSPGGFRFLLDAFLAAGSFAVVSPLLHVWTTLWLRACIETFATSTTSRIQLLGCRIQTLSAKAKQPVSLVF